MGENAKIGLRIDGKELFADEGTTILDAAKQNGIYIPTLCHHPNLSHWGGCRICMVEVDGAPRLVASCVMPVREGMEVVTSNDRIVEARRAMLEFLFAERNHYCMFCAQSGDCELQTLAYELHMDHLTVPSSYEPFTLDTTDDFIVIDHNRCILCGRCVRACQEIAGNFVLNYQNRGSRTLIGKDLNEASEGSSCISCGVCMQVCPTGAIFNRHRTYYAVKGKSKDWKTVESICPQCGLICPTICFVQDNNLLKIEGKLNGDRPDRGQLCRKGRFEPMMDGRARLLRPMMTEEDQGWKSQAWEKTIELVGARLSSTRDAFGGRALFGLASSQCSNEELFAFRDLMSRGWGAGIVGVLEGAQWRASDSWKDRGTPCEEASWQQIPEADFILVFGADPSESQPVISSMIKRAIFEKKVKLAVIAGYDVMDPWSSFFIPIRRGSEAATAKALLAAVTASGEAENSPNNGAGSDEVTKALEKVGLDGEARQNLAEVARLFLQSKNLIILAGEEVTSLVDPAALRCLTDMALSKGLLEHNTLRLLVLKPGGNSAGAMSLGLSSYRGPEDIETCRGGIILLGGEETLDASLLHHLGGMEFLAVVSPYVPEPIAHKAHVLIPKPLWMEEEGSYTSVDGREVAYKSRVLEPPKGVKPTWQVLLDLARVAGFRSDYKDLEGLSQKARREIQGGRSKMRRTRTHRSEAAS